MHKGKKVVTVEVGVAVARALKAAVGALSNLANAAIVAAGARRLPPRGRRG